MLAKKPKLGSLLVLGLICACPIFVERSHCWANDLVPLPRQTSGNSPNRKSNGNETQTVEGNKPAQISADENQPARQESAIDPIETASPQSFDTPLIDFVESRPGFVLIPGTTSSLKIGGYIKLDGIYDFKDAGDRFVFDPKTIPVSGGAGAQSSYTVRQTRLNLDIITPAGGDDFRLFFEGDFASSVNSFRMRHAFGEYGSFLAGQTWTLATDPDAIPETLDFNGPDGALLARRPQVRWTTELAEGLTWATALDDPKLQVESTIDGESRRRVPALSSCLRIRNDRGHIYVFSGVSENRFVPIVGEPSSEVIWGTGISILRNFGDDHLIFQAGVAEGFTEFVPSLFASSNPNQLVAGEIDALLTYGFVASYHHKWNELFRSNLAYRSAYEKNSPLQPLDAHRYNQYVACNLICSPLENNLLDVGLEYLWGNRQNKDGQSNDAHRLQFSAIFRIR